MTGFESFSWGACRGKPLNGVAKCLRLIATDRRLGSRFKNFWVEGNVWVGMPTILACKQHFLGDKMRICVWRYHRTRPWMRGIVPSLALLFLWSCSAPTPVASKTQCQAAVARTIMTWKVEYYTSRANPGTRRVEAFGQAQLINRNGEKPGPATATSDRDGLWWPESPARPTQDQIDRQRRAAEENDPPELRRQVEYVLQCDQGDLLTDAETYRQVAQVIRTGQIVSVTHRFGKVLETDLSLPDGKRASNGTGETVSGDEASSSGKAVPAALSVVYVHPEKGSDSGAGTEAEPLKTITHAIAKTRPGGTIHLGPGTYDVARGETFPLHLKPGQILQGDETSQGNGIVILGGGDFTSPSWAKQSVAVLATDGAQVRGLTLSNPKIRGSAVWVESGSPILAKNTFTGSHREGVFVSGDAKPELRNNRFEKNGGNGVSFTRNSGGLLIENRIQNSGYGVVVGDRATPRLENNQISDNRSGIVISGSARPVLRGNAIANNQQDGIVVTNEAQPILHNNRLSRNGNYDIHNNTGRPLQIDAGNLAGIKIQGDVQ